MRVTSLIDACHFITNTNKKKVPDEIMEFINRRPIDWELRQLAELVLLIRYSSEKKELLKDICSYLNFLEIKILNAPQINSYATCVSYMKRIREASLDEPWESSIEKIEQSLRHKKERPVETNISLNRNYINSQINLCRSNINKWKKKLQSINVNLSETHNIHDITPQPQLIADLIGVTHIPSEYDIINLKNESTWRKWFTVPDNKHTNQHTNVWFQTDDLMTRETAFIWHSIHDGAHIFHQSLLNQYQLSIFLGSYPYWGIAESFAMYIEHQVFSRMINGPDKLISSYIEQFNLCYSGVIKSLLDGFIEREFRWLSSLLHFVSDKRRVAIVEENLDDFLHISNLEFNSLFPMQWYYTRGHETYKKLEHKELLSTLIFKKNFPHPEFSEIYLNATNINIAHKE